MTPDRSLGFGSLSNLAKIRDCRAKRVSSYDQTGGNADFVPIKGGESRIIADIKGSGCIRHIWFGGGASEPFYHRKILLRMYWDGEASPSVDVPMGDFFGVGHGASSDYYSLPLSMYRADSADRPTRNCWFSMPFSNGAKIELMNECNSEMQAYFYIDYEEHESIPEDFGRFHAQWRRVNPCIPVDMKGKNLTGKDNYVILDAEGKGQYVGCNLSVHNLHPGWYGEGDDMIFVDGEDFPPSLHGTGTEDFFLFSYEFPVKDTAYGLYHGVSLAGSTRQSDWGDLDNKSNEWTIYRFHIEDPIPFKKSIKVTIEHGHANDRGEDYSSTAYWYQIEPHKPFPEMLSVKDRLPLERVTE